MYLLTWKKNNFYKIKWMVIVCAVYKEFTKFYVMKKHSNFKEKTQNNNDCLF
jgi:hypothetical protein